METMVYRPWNIKEFSPIEEYNGIEPSLLSHVLLARGYQTKQEMTQRCYGTQVLSDPMLLSGMEKAVERIHKAIDADERIVVFGDYDVDGVTATAMLYSYLESVGAQVFYKLPNREKDGYGLSMNAIEMMAEKEVNLVITVDNGITAVGEIARAQEYGIDVIVTDHHTPPQELPCAYSLINPHLPDDQSPCKTLCGAGVAFKLICALEGVSCEEMIPYYGDFAAIGTVADIMVLEGENRTLVQQGLCTLEQTEREGLRALLDVCQLQQVPLTAQSIAFRIAPRLNAAGRMQDATLALDLLLCDDPDYAQELAQRLESQNTDRKQTEQEMVSEILQQIQQNPEDLSGRILVLWGKNWHAGVIGIVASRMVEKFAKPAIIISVDENGQGKGSGRSIAGISLYDAIASAKDLLVQFGGHQAAAGLTIREECLQDFRSAVNEWAQREHFIMPLPPIEVDAQVNLSELTLEQVQALSVLEPFGHGNPTPVFLVKNVVIDAVFSVRDGKHARVRFSDGVNMLSAMMFQAPPQLLEERIGQRVDILIEVSIFEGKNGAMVSAIIRDIRPTGLTNEFTQQVAVAQMICTGLLQEKQQYQALLPTREDTVKVYRFLCKHRTGFAAEDLRPMFAALGQEQAGKMILSLKALEQLHLIACIEDENKITRWRVVPTSEKKDLSSAPILNLLKGE